MNNKEQQLEPGENFSKKNSEVLFFDPAKEVEYLKKIDGDKKYLALTQELKTAIQELTWVQGGSLNRVLDEGRIKDPKTNVFIDQFITDNPSDILAFNRIQNALSEGNNLVVHFSPQNIELGYPANVVDFWLNNEKDGKIKFLRFFVDDNLEKMKLVYKAFGGKEETKSSNDLLINPLVVNDFRMVDVMSNLVVSDKKIETTKERIDGVVDKVVSRFYKKFGNRIFWDEDLIEKRIYSGIIDVVMNGKSFEDIEIEGYISENIEIYMYAQILQMQVRNLGGACPGIVKTAEFGSTKMMVVNENGSIVFKPIENTDGLKKCKACGYWYSGDNCPICK